MSLQSVHNILSNVAYKLTDKETNTAKNISSFAKVISEHILEIFLYVQSYTTYMEEFGELLQTDEVIINS